MLILQHKIVPRYTSMSKMKTYAQLLRYAEAYKGLVSYMAEDGSKKDNYFGSDTYKIAAMLRRLSDVESEFMSFRDDIIRKHNPDNDLVVSNEQRQAIEKEYAYLLETEVIQFGDLIRLDYNALCTPGNKISPQVIAILFDYIDNLPE